VINKNAAKVKIMEKKEKQWRLKFTAVVPDVEK
jgi:hypothetical protein